MISVDGLAVEFGGTTLFSDISFVINEKDRIALMGKNGAGKSTLLKILAGVRQPTRGKVSAPKDCVVAYLPQHLMTEDGRTVFDETAQAFAHLHEMEAQIDRLNKELVHNVALRVEETEDADAFRVSGRGELHLSVLIENMRREGFEMAVSRPKVIFREIDGRKQEPFENVTLDVEEQHQGSVMQALGERKGDLKNMNPDGKGRVLLFFFKQKTAYEI